MVNAPNNAECCEDGLEVASVFTMDTSGACQEGGFKHAARDPSWDDDISRRNIQGYDASAVHCNSQWLHNL
jgi:hypothetical protein